MDSHRFSELHKLVRDYAASKGLSATLKIRPVERSYHAIDSELFIRVFRALPGQPPTEYPGGFTFSPDAPDLEAQIQRAIDEAGEALK